VPRSRLHLVASGRVQGVWYRGSVAEVARAAALLGWVRNLPDGRVELQAEGERPALEALVAHCRVGPAAARVEAVDVEWSDPKDDLGPFEVIR
jgi:acylphosphatase